MSHERLLIVDDDKEIRDALTEVLEDEGYVVEAAVNGADALSRLRAGSGALPGLILLDLMMPIMDGPQFRSAQLGDPRLATIPILVLSADRNATLKGEALGGAEACTKPIRLETLLAAIERTLSARTTA